MWPFAYLEKSGVFTFARCKYAVWVWRLNMFNDPARPTLYFIFLAFSSKNATSYLIKTCRQCAKLNNWMLLLMHIQHSSIVPVNYATNSNMADTKTFICNPKICVVADCRVWWCCEQHLIHLYVICVVTSQNCPSREPRRQCLFLSDWQQTCVCSFSSLSKCCI